MSNYDDFQNELKKREFCIGWKQDDTQTRIYSDVLYTDWHEANSIACGACQPGFSPFVEPAIKTQMCTRCNGTGTADVVGNDYNCPRCYGRGRIRDI